MTLGDFSHQADAYRRSRPTYPATLLDRLVSDAGLKPGDPVADFGAGTGIMTRLLIERQFVVSAIEPNDSMRRQADVPAAHWVSGTFEQSGLESASQRWAIAAQAFHWADPLHCLPEIRRILQPGCLFTVLWNNRIPGKSEVVGWTEEAIRRNVPDFDEVYRNKPIDLILESTGDFTFATKQSVSHSIPMSRDRYLELWKSHNRLNTIAGPERFGLFLQELTAYLDRHQFEQIDVAYECDAWTARRND